MHKTFLRYCFFVFGSFCTAFVASGQTDANSLSLSKATQQNTPGLGKDPKQKEYYIGGVTTTGAQYLDKDLLLAVSGLSVGDKISMPYDEKIAKAIRNLWKQDLFADVRIEVSKTLGDKIFLNIAVEERPKLSRYNFRGIKKSEAQELKDRVGLVKARVVTEATEKDATVKIKKYFSGKGFSDVQVKVTERIDTTGSNSVSLTFDINKGSKTKINQINITGNNVASDSRLKRTLRGTKEAPRISLHPADEVSVYGNNERYFGNYVNNFGFLSLSKTLDALDPYFRYNFFTSSKFDAKKFDDDKLSLIGYYNSLGYRDATVVKDTIYKVENGNLNIDLKISEGHKYYFGNMEWKGNTKYSSEHLSLLLGIKKGDVYNQGLLESRLGRQMNPEGGQDISSLYMDDGYLFFSIDPVEASIVGDTINFEMRVTEGPQATIKNITISGNDRTNEYVIRRELYTLPGNKFSRTDIVRSQRQIANLGFFDAEKIGIQPIPNQEDGTVDIEYTVVEKSSDQLQLSAGFGGGVKFYGNIGVVFNNFSLKNIFKPKFWDPLPVGDGQKFSVNYQSNGYNYNSLNFGFTEPWLGGRKPNALTTNIIYSKFAGDVKRPIDSFMRVAGGGLSLSKRVKWPDDNFVFTYGLNYQNIFLKDYTFITDDNNQPFNNGYSNNMYFKLVLARYSVDQPLYPRSGSNVSFTFQFTPPYSTLEGKDYTGKSPNEKYKWVEYHKYRFTAEWYQRIVGNMVFKLASKYGFLGYYNPTIGFSPFERFQLGGDGLGGYNFFIGRDIIAQRGYKNPYATNATIFNKYTAEVRYPFSLSPTATIYGLAFVEGANAWSNFKQYNPFKLNRDAGLGLRIFLPMFGLLGIDYGVGFDKYSKEAGRTKLSDLGSFTFMLGFEPD